jgi:hypothetical protein
LLLEAVTHGVGEKTFQFFFVNPKTPSPLAGIRPFLHSQKKGHGGIP